MKNTVLCIAFCVYLLGHAAFGYSQQWRQQVNFTIDVTLNDREHTLDAFEKIAYINNSPDTLQAIWFHLWANAYKNDRTAYSEYLLSKDRTDFYFSDKGKKGYINRLDFKVNGITARMEDHPAYIDIIRLLLPTPLPPGATALITTPFHVQLPYNFSGNGYLKRSYDIVQWNPFPAVYDAHGWHPEPFTNQAEPGGETGNYEVSIHAPASYRLAAGNARPEDTDTVTDPRTARYVQNGVRYFRWSATAPQVTSIIKPGTIGFKKPVHYGNSSKKTDNGLIYKIIDTTRIKPVSVLPAIGFNNYDGIMIGAVLHNYQSSQNRFRFIAVPLFATNSSKLNGLARASYTWPLPGKIFKTAEAALTLSHFSMKAGLDTNRHKLFEQFSKLVPSFRLYLTNEAGERHEKWIGFKSYLITERTFDNFVTDSDDSLNYINGSKSTFRYVNELTFFEKQRRILYPYDYKVQLQQGKEFYRINVTGNYFFNYANGGGASARIFAVKFGYLTNDLYSRFNATRYMPKLLGNTGEEDYTYSDYFIGRTASYGYSDDAVKKNGGLASQQIMLRDGAFKMRADQFDYLQGISDNWLASLNLTTTLPYKILPPALPLKVFLDIGTQSESWKEGNDADRFVFDAGFQLSLFKEALTIYVPVFYSNVFKDYFKSYTENRFLKTISFSLNIQNLVPAKIFTDKKRW